MANIVDKYLNTKKKQIYEYCKSVNEFLSYDNNQIWKTPGELNDIMKDVISAYVDKYYFEVLENFDEYTEYLGPLVKSDNRFKTILVCSLKTIPDNLKVGNFKISSYIISLIIYTGIILDRFTYPYNNYKVNSKNVESIVGPMFSSVSFVKFEDNSKKIKELTNEVKKNDMTEKEFISALDSLNSKESRNEYESVDKDNKFYKVIYKYEIPELKEFRNKDADKYFKRIVDDLNCISYELATTAALKIKLLNKNITILFPIELEFYSKESEINKISKIMENQEIKNVIKLYIKYQDYKKHTNVIRLLTNAGFKTVIEFEDSVEVPYSTFNEIKLTIINNDFVKLNSGNIESWTGSGVSFIVKNIVLNKPISELKMLGLREE